MVSDGAPAKLVKALVHQVKSIGAVYEIIAPKMAGATLDNGTMGEAKQKIDGGPSVLYDAVALVLSAEGAAMLSKDKRPRTSFPTPTPIASSSATRRTPCR
jgi:catalase